MKCYLRHGIGVPNGSEMLGGSGPFPRVPRPTGRAEGAGVRSEPAAQRAPPAARLPIGYRLRGLPGPRLGAPTAVAPGRRFVAPPYSPIRLRLHP